MQFFNYVPRGLFFPVEKCSEEMLVRELQWFGGLVLIVFAESTRLALVESIAFRGERLQSRVRSSLEAFKISRT